MTATDRQPGEGWPGEQRPGEGSLGAGSPVGGGRDLESLESLGPYRLTVNGRRREVADGWLGENLLDVLRDRLGLPGSKNACQQGECGSCSVLLDGVLVCACCVLAVDAAGSEVVTVEGLAPEGEATDLQRAFVEEGAVQCGFCTPGLVVALTDLLDRRPAADDLEVREAIAGNLCRCTGYGRILAAVRTVQQERADDGA